MTRATSSQPASVADAIRAALDISNLRLSPETERALIAAHVRAEALEALVGTMEACVDALAEEVAAGAESDDKDTHPAIVRHARLVTAGTAALRRVREASNA